MTHPAIEFLQALDSASDATFNIEHYSDIPKGDKKPNPDPLGGRYANLTLAEVEALIPRLHAINERGAGIFVARNQCIGHRSEANVTRIRGVHADMDDTTDAQLANVAAVLQPSIVVQSSGPRRCQLYWQIAEGELQSKAETKAINQRLVKTHGADKAAVDVSRLLRIPGFKHMKYRAEGKTPTITGIYHDLLYTADRLDEQVVKMLAGREPISARFLHQEFFEFTPSFTPWLRTNHKPIITGLDDGIWRRLVLLPFSRKFTDNEKDPALEQKLLDEQDAILMWMVEGAKLYLKGGIKLSPRMRSELGTYRSESDLLGEFLLDQTISDTTGKVSQSLVYSSYRRWCEDCGVRPLSKKTFTQRLAERGFPEGKSGKNRYYTGLVWCASLPSSTQDGVDRMKGISGISLHGNLSFEKTPNSPSSCPSCPPHHCDGGIGHG